MNIKVLVLSILVVCYVKGTQTATPSCLPELSDADKQKKANEYEAMTKKAGSRGRLSLGKMYKVQYQKNPDLFGGLKIIEDTFDKKAAYINEICIQKFLVGTAHVVQFIDALIIDVPATGKEPKKIKVYILLEVGDQSLEELMGINEDQKTSIAQLLKTFKDVFLGIDNIHKKGIVHGAIIPNNIILFKDGAKITDFKKSGLSMQGKQMYYKPGTTQTDLAAHNLAWMHVEGSSQVGDLKKAVQSLHNSIYHCSWFKMQSPTKLWIPAGIDSIIFQIILKGVLKIEEKSLTGAALAALVDKALKQTTFKALEHHYLVDVNGPKPDLSGVTWVDVDGLGLFEEMKAFWSDLKEDSEDGTGKKKKKLMRILTNGDAPADVKEETSTEKEASDVAINSSQQGLAKAEKTGLEASSKNEASGQKSFFSNYKVLLIVVFVGVVLSFAVGFFIYTRSKNRGNQSNNDRSAALHN